MQKIIITAALAIPALQAFTQAKKPTIMVVPSDVLCIRKSYTTVYDDQGTQKTIPYYKAAMQNDADLRLVITKMGNMMADRGFPLKDLEQEIKSIEQETAEMNLMGNKSGAAVTESPIDLIKRNAKADVIMDLDFEVKTSGPKKYVVFTLKGLDAYTNKQVASAAGTGTASFSTQPEVLLEEAVLSHIDNFNDQLQAHFEDMFEKGREVTIQVKVWEDASVNLEEEYTYNGNKMELGEILERWMEDNTVESRFTTEDITETMAKFEQVRIPVYDDREKAMDARKFAQEIRRFLKGDPFLIDSKVYQRGLGEAWVIIGGK